MTDPEKVAQRATEMLRELRANLAQSPPVQLTRPVGLIRPVLLNRTELAGMIDHTALKPETTPAMIDTLCQEARDHGFASVCVNSGNVARCVHNLTGTGVPVCSVVGFPLGASTEEAKAYEALQAIMLGAAEIDMVINIGALKGADYELVRDDVLTVVGVCHAHDAICKTIIEAVLLTDEEKVAACLLAVEAGADYVKTSTGFAPGGATVEDVALMRSVVGPDVGVKAAGGIRTYEAAAAMIAAGATRIGASAGIAIIQGVPE